MKQGMPEQFYFEAIETTPAGDTEISMVPGELVECEYPDGCWIVFKLNGERVEHQVDLPILDPEMLMAGVSQIIRDMDGDALWAEAMAGADMTQTASGLMMGIIADQFEV